jgi:hypothetical protein
MVLNAMYHQEIKSPRSNNQPQITSIVVLDNNFDPVGELFSFPGKQGSGPGSGWFSLDPDDALPDAALVQITAACDLPYGLP